MPALAAACLTIACVFWRTGLIEVWYTTFSFLPSLVRTPSDPRFQPAASRIWLALSMLSSHLLFFEANLDGAFRKFAVACPWRP